MTFTSFYRITNLGLVNFWRNRWLSLAATLMMTLTLMIVSFFALLNLSINAVSDTVLKRLDIEVFFFDDNIKDEKIANLAADLKARSDVAEVKYISKDAAKDTFSDYEIDKDVTSQISSDFNPLPRSLRIKANDPEKISSIASFIKQDQYKDIVCQEKKCISDNFKKSTETRSKLLKITDFVRTTGLIVGIIFILVSTLIVLNTIRLTMFTRRNEIEIMKLVGAGHAFIHFPFIIESVLYGLIATALSLIIIALGIRSVSPYVSHYAQLINLDLMRYFKQYLWQIVGLELGVSLLIAVFCSFVSIRKYLRT